jgi:hypothetical protein
MQKVKTEFQQLGQDLRAGNLTAAQSIFPLGRSYGRSAARTRQRRVQLPGFHQLATDLKAGNTTAAQQDVTKVQQDFQAHHHRRYLDGNTASDASQIFGPLGQALQPGNLPAGPQPYAT